MTIIRRCLALCGVAAVLVGCSEDAADYRAMKADEVCGLVTVDEARSLMKDITDESLDASGETRVGLPVCRYGSGDGKPYLTVSIHQSSQLKPGGKVAVAGQEAVQQDSDSSCSVFVPLEEHLYLLAIVESWDPAKDTCPVATQALEKAYPRLTD